MTPAETAPASAYDRPGGAGDPRCVPLTLEAEPAFGAAIAAPDYPAEDHATWATLFARQTAALPGVACEEFLRGLDLLGLPADRVPALAAVSAGLERATGWRCARIPGLLHERDFFGLLARRIFPSTDYLRRPDELDYTPAPDCFHDIFGHCPLITLPAFADFYREVGLAGAAAAARGAAGAADLRAVQRFYWYTVEFGLIATPAGPRVYGNGILSSRRETEHCLTDTVDRRPFALAEVLAADYDVWRLQDVLYVVDSFEGLRDAFAGWAAGRGLL